MQFLIIAFVFLLGIAQSIVAGDEPHLKQGIEEDLVRLKETYRRDSCTEPRITDSLKNFTCQCGGICSQLGTCCIDSPYLLVPPPNPRPTCRLLDGGRSHFMVDRCANNNDLQSMCEGEWNGDGDAKKIVPVTSLFTFITYKNYFCFRCHETTDDFVYWDVRLRRLGEFDHTIALNQLASLTYDKKYQTWFAPFGPKDSPVSVIMSMQVPSGLGSMIPECEPLVISNCSREWTDKDLRDKCEAYMGVIEIAKNASTLKYKNMHCALCNLEDLNGLLNERSSVTKRAVPFPFLRFRSKERKVEIPQCKKDYVWDSFFKKCRKLQCALPGYVYNNGKCIRQSRVKKRAVPFSFLGLSTIDLKRERKFETSQCEEDYVWDSYFKKCRKLQCALPGHVLKDGKCVRQ